MTNNQEKLVPCPACSGNGYIRDPEVEYVDCNYCSSQGEVEESYAKEWPLK
jgi:DnaJ-class molecular chaperone